MKITILDEAEQDLLNGFTFYESQESGLGDYFLNTLFGDIDSLKLYAGIHSKVFGFHRLLSSRFPYAIYYSLHNETVFVIAVLDCRRNPVRAETRLKKRRTQHIQG
ncbi:MAG: type II toxin-antitoxin system RelE/ParE family toxin [Kiritimatiellaeota bacterium]|nr:type II toxin-antitoxin system RelE/ParE family toxin [Kiritimatiellota bacterium]